MEEASAQLAPVGKFVVDNLVGDYPANEDAGQETDYRQEYLTGDEVEPVEQRPSEESESVDSSQ